MWFHQFICNDDWKIPKSCNLQKQNQKPKKTKKPNQKTDGSGLNF